MFYPRLPARSGNAIIMALGVFTLVAVMVVSAVDSSAIAGAQTRAGAGHQRALAALDAVLARREVLVVERASQGDPVEIARWTGNYGVDFVGDVEVRWKIEPVRTPPSDASGNPVAHIANPSPNANWTVPTSSPVDPVTGEPYWQANDTNFMFRIAGEARAGADPNTDEKKNLRNQANEVVIVPANVVQGARYASVLKEPLFRYVIFYAARGAKGDLELSHSDNVTIQGAVHSNGALYIGGGLKVNDKVARVGPTTGTLAPAFTKIGPDIDGNVVRVNGVDGIFRISKPLMYSILNGFWLYNNSVVGTHGDPNTSTGADPTTDWTAAGSYDLTTPTSSLPLPLDPVGASLGSITEATDYGRRVNPYRILDGSGAINENSKSNTDSLRTINNVPIRGVPYMNATTGADVANDSRDLFRAADQKWTVLSPQASAPGFDGKARSKLTGQNIKTLPERMRNRGLEAQRMQYADCDGDDATDEHEYARPMFVKADGSITADYPRAALPGFPTFDSNAVVEEPGQYLRYALGDDNSYMVRYPTGEGWYIRNRTGAFPSDPAFSGLIIRERPTPRADYWPGSNPPSLVNPASSRWLPFAYGKHWYPSNFRFTVADIAEVCAPATADPWSYSSWSDNPLAANRINTTDAARSLSYSPGGRLTFSGAQNASGLGNNFYNGYNDTSNGSYQRKPYFYAQNWRFVHLGQHAIDTSKAGLKVTVFNDAPTGSPTGVSSQSLVGGSLVVNGDLVPVTTPATGIIALPSVANSASGIQTVGSTPASLVSARRSVRFEGFLTPTVSNLYYVTASVGANQAVRVWVDGNLAYTNWGVTTTTAQRLTAGRASSIMIDYYNDGNASPSLFVNWQPIEPALGVVTQIPATVFNPPVANPGIERAKFTSVTVRINQPFQITGPNQKKIGLMVRDGSGGMSPLLNGAAQYAFVGFSPLRGVFTERRAARHQQQNRTYGTYYIGQGSRPGPPVTPADAQGQLPYSSRSDATVARVAVLTQTALVNNATTQSTSTIATPDYASDSTTAWTAPTAYSGPMSKDVGGGKIWTLLQGFSTGPRTATRTIQTRRRTTATTTTSCVQTVTLTGHQPAGPFTDDDAKDANGAVNGTSGERNRLYIFNAATGTGTLSGGDRINYSATIAANTTQPTTTARWYLFGGTTTDRTQLKRYYSNPASATNTTLGGTFTNTATVGSASTIWSTSGTIQINKNGVISNATLSDIVTVTGGSFTGMNPSLTVPVPAVTYPAVPAFPAYPAAVAPTVVNLATGKTFQVQRSGATVRFDLNSFITRSGTWLSAVAPQYLPTMGTTWPAVWSASTPTTWPTTGSFRPDVSTGAPLPAYSAVAVNPTGSAGQQAASGYAMTDDIAIPSTITSLWLRATQAGTTLSFSYSTDGTTFIAVPGTLDIVGWGSHLLLGPALQSGDVATATSATFSDMRITTTNASPNDIIDANDWDKDASGEDIMGRYLASQYQVWWGNHEITEDFFTWTDTATGRRNAVEDWIYNTREFWSQPRWWEHRGPGNILVPKDDETAPKTTFNNTRLREAFAKTTLLSLDMEALQNYLRSRLLSEAVEDRMPGNHDAQTVPSDYTLYTRFSGLVYAVRTNRFPWNPNINPWLKDQRLAIRDGGGAVIGYSADTSGINPWSPHWNSQLPNSVADMASTTPELGNGAALSNPAYAWLTAAQGHLLQPYVAADLKDDPPMKPQQFHHGVRLTNASSIHWGYDGSRVSLTTRSIGTSGTVGTDWRWSSSPQFGLSKTSIVTPNSLYLQGNVNVDTHETTRGTDTKQRFTPLAVMADSVVLQSNAWKDVNAQLSGLTVTNVAGSASVTGSGTLATMMSQGTVASDTEINAAIATHNQPSTRDRVAEGQSAPFVDTMMLIENWNGKTMSYLGSLVVMDSRRYTDAFLHDSYKTYGRTPFGVVDNDSKWLTTLNSFIYRRPDWDGTLVQYKTGLYGFVASVNWAGQSPAILSEASRVYRFNYDLLTEEGTPPFAPFGVSTSGVGGWARITK